MRARHPIVLLLAGAAAVGPGAAIATAGRSARSIKIKLTLSDRSSAAKPPTGRVSGTLRGTYTAKIVPPAINYVLTVPGGTLDISAFYTLQGTAVTGAWRATGGKGAFEHAHGSGPATGSLRPGSAVHWSGTLKY